MLIHDIQMSILLEVGSLLAPQYSRFRTSGPTHFPNSRVQQLNVRRSESKSARVHTCAPIGRAGQRIVATSWRFARHLCTLWTLQRPSARLTGSETQRTVLPIASGRRTCRWSFMLCVLRTDGSSRHDAGEWFDA